MGEERQEELFDMDAARALGIKTYAGAGGVECPQCGCTEREVEKTVRIKNAVRRYSHCAFCGKKITTIERHGAY